MDASKPLLILSIRNILLRNAFTFVIGTIILSIGTEIVEQGSLLRQSKFQENASENTNFPSASCLLIQNFLLPEHKERFNQKAKISPEFIFSGSVDLEKQAPSSPFSPKR